MGYSDAHISRLEKGMRLPDPAAVHARFLDALFDGLNGEPALAHRLIELARHAHMQRRRRHRPSRQPT